MLKKTTLPTRLIGLLIFALGISISLYLGQKLKTNARKSWYNQATKVAENATDHSLSWFALQQTQLRGVAALFYGSGIVTEDNFFDVLDLTETPESLPFQSIGYAIKNPTSTESRYNIAITSGINSFFQKGIDPMQNSAIIFGINTAKEFPGEVVMSPPFIDMLGSKLFGLFITTPDLNSEGILLATINLQNMFNDLLTLHVPKGLHLQSVKMASMATGTPAKKTFFSSEPFTEVSTQDFHIRVDSGKSHLDFLWSLSADFLNGPKIGLGLLVQIAGCFFNLTFFAILHFLAKENIRVKIKVQQRTAELTAATKNTQQEILKKTVAEHALMESGARFQALSNASFEAIFFSENGYCTDLNKTAEQMFGYSREEAVGAHVSILFSQANFDKVISRINLENKIPYKAIASKKDGSEIPVLIRGRTIRNSGKKIRITAISDISEQKKAELAMEESEKRYRTLIDTTNTGFLVVNLKGYVLEANMEYAKILGYTSSKKLIGRNVIEWTAEYDRQKQKIEGRKCSSSGKCSNYIVDYITYNNETVPVEINASVILQDDQHVIIALVRDISSQKELEAERLKTKKLESVGVLAGGIAHDFNNILVAILGNLSLAKQFISKQEKTFSLISEAEKASFRAKDLTQQLLTFAKGGAPIIKEASLESLIRDSADFILSGSNIVCEYMLPSDLWLVNVDAGQISQVIQNLIINSVQAIHGSGKINITCQNINKGNNFLPEALSEPKYVQVIIRDNGSGIPKDIITKIFDPYFSTKQEGTGLGLALTHSIITKHNGHISVTSEIDHGTQCIFYLPAIPKKGKELKSIVPMISPGNGRILIMDDDEVVKNVAKEMLTHLGYDVLLAADGDEALTIYKEHLYSNKPIDFTIMDLTIPGGMGGKEAAVAFLNIDENSKIIVSSGYSNDPVMAEYQKYGFIAAISKPFSLEELSTIFN